MDGSNTGGNGSSAAVADTAGAMPDMSTDLVNGGEGIVVTGDSGMDLRSLTELTLAEQDENGSGEADGPGAKAEPRQDNGGDDQERSTSSESDEPDVGESEDYADDPQYDETGTDGTRDSVSGDDAGVSVRDGERDVQLSKDAEVTITVDGKKETLTLQEALNKASGATHLERELSNHGREKKKFEIERDGFYEESRQISVKAEAILAADDPREVAALIADMKGEDPEKVWQDMIKVTVDTIRREQRMTPTEKKQDIELRGLRRDKAKLDAKRAVDERIADSTHKREALTTDLGTYGFEMKDFQNALSEVQEISKAGEELGFGLDETENIDEDAIIGWMVERDIWNRLESEVTKINPKLMDDDGFTTRARRAIYKCETRDGKMSSADVARFIKGAIELETKATSESLSKKAGRRSTSKRATSQEQENGEGFASIQDYMDSMRRDQG